MIECEDIVAEPYMLHTVQFFEFTYLGGYKCSWADLKFTGTPTVRDLWRQKNIDAGADGISAQVNAHGAELYRVEAANPAK